MRNAAPESISRALQGVDPNTCDRESRRGFAPAFRYVAAGKRNMNVARWSVRCATGAFGITLCASVSAHDGSHDNPATDGQDPDWYCYDSLCEGYRDFGDDVTNVVKVRTSAAGNTHLSIDDRQFRW